MYKLMDIKKLEYGKICGKIDLEGLLLKREKIIIDGERLHLGAPVVTS